MPPRHGQQGRLFTKPHPEHRCVYCDCELPPPKQGPQRVMCDSDKCLRQYKADWKRARGRKQVITA